MFRYFDIHTHHRRNDNDVVVIENIRITKDTISSTVTTPFSAGIHPYDAQTASDELFEQLQTLAHQPRCVAIGECGIDKRMPNVELQTQIFKRHVTIAQNLNLPLIVHCVHAQNEILKIVHSLQTPIIFHSYAKYNAQIAARTNILFSLNDRTINHPHIADIPLSKIVFETDDQDISIKEVYQNYCRQMGFDIEFVGQSVERTIEKTFNIV